MKKILLFGIPSLLIIVLAYFFVFRDKPTTEQSDAGATPSSVSSLPASTPSNNKTINPITNLENTPGGKLLYDSSSGKVAINNFTKNAEIADSGVIYPVDEKNYNIGYNSTSKEFIITLLVNNNIESSRREAENDLLSALDISKEDACKIKVYLYVSAALTKDDSLSQNHGLSFCPGSTTFPN